MNDISDEMIHKLLRTGHAEDRRLGLSFFMEKYPDIKTVSMEINNTIVKVWPIELLKESAPAIFNDEPISTNSYIHPDHWDII